MGKATQDLREEHDSILHVLGVLDRMKDFAPMSDTGRFKRYEEVVYFLKIFADKCHHGKEEGYLFPELVSKGVPNENGPVGVMLQDHKLGRDYISAMSQAAAGSGIIRAAATRYADLLRKHTKGKQRLVCYG